MYMYIQMYKYIDYILLVWILIPIPVCMLWGSIPHISKRFFNTSCCIIQFNSDIIYPAIA